jgi:acetoacetyl-CoA synthetase
VNEAQPLREGALLWLPSEAFKAASTMTDYMAWLERERGLRFANYAELSRWSVDDLAGFWSSVVDYRDPAQGAWTEVLGDATMPGALVRRAQLNYAERFSGVSCRIGRRSCSPRNEPLPSLGSELQAP